MAGRCRDDPGIGTCAKMDSCAVRRGLGGDVARGNPVAKPVNVGVIGLGEVAQIIHLPILEALGDRFRLTASATSPRPC